MNFQRPKTDRDRLLHVKNRRPESQINSQNLKSTPKALKSISRCSKLNPRGPILTPRGPYLHTEAKNQFLDAYNSNSKNLELQPCSLNSKIDSYYRSKIESQISNINYRMSKIEDQRLKIVSEKLKIVYRGSKIAQIPKLTPRCLKWFPNAQNDSLS